MLIETIDTRHGTANQYNFSNGNCLPYTGVPFGMNYFAPQTTDQKGNWWFHPKDRVFQGYRLTHQPSPWMGDFSYALFTPVSGDLHSTSLFHTQSSYRPEESVFNPTHISIYQSRYQIKSTLIPSMYGGILNINYSQMKNGILLTIPCKYKYKVLSPQKLSLEVINFMNDLKVTFSFSLMLNNP